jgi:uncharacterized protein YciI
MSSTLPPDLALEQLWLVEATYAPDAAETRGPFRARHLSRLVELREAGIVVEAGAYTDVSSSLVLLRVDSEEAALDVCRGDVYMKNGVWVELRARPFSRAIRRSAGA